MRKQDVLKDYFGYTCYRNGQEEIIDNILKGRDTLGIMPTGAGKSICYQVPALMLNGITLVISPLISLMKDQVNSLTQVGINAAFLNSSLNYNDYRNVLENATNGKYKILYIAPERLLTDEFISFAQNVNITMLTVDEAHCVSQWGQDFRPSYLKITQFINKLDSRPIVTAFTATATVQVKEDIMEKLELADPYVLTTGFDRKNLFFSVQKPKDKFIALKAYLHDNNEKTGIVYCSTRKTVDEVCSKLVQEGFSAIPYHAGLLEQVRKNNQEAFIYDKNNIMVATNAFGMGIDKSNVSYVIHYNMPKNIESYYQEAGRAGRDGEPADCILLYSGQDVIINQFLIDNSNDTKSDMDSYEVEAIKEKDRQLLKQMTFYCHSNDCLRQYILNYFGEKTINYCGNCSSCNTNFQEEDITVDAQKIMSCIKRSGQRFGVKMIVDILRGSKNKRLLTSRLDKISTYNIMAKVSEAKIRDIINFLAIGNYVEITNSEYPILKLTRQSNEVLFGDIKLRMKVLNEYKVKAKDKQFEQKSKVLNDKVDSRLFDKLRLLRNKIAINQGVPAYIVFADAALKDMCKRMPSNSLEFLEVSGVGQAKLEKYGKEFLREINDYRNG